MQSALDALRFHHERISALMPDEWYEELIRLGNIEPDIIQKPMNAAITTLETSLAVLQTNEPIHRAAGQVEQADLEVRSVRDIEVALHRLRAHAQPKKTREDLISSGALTQSAQEAYRLATSSNQTRWTRS